MKPTILVILTAFILSPLFTQANTDVIHDTTVKQKKCEMLTQNEFENIATLMRGRASEQTKLNHAIEAIGDKCISVSQSADLITLLQLDEHRLKLAKYCFDHITTEDGFDDKIVPLMHSEKSKEELKKYISH